MTLRPFLFLLALMSMSCDLQFPKKDKRQEALSQLLQTDADFADMAVEKGYRKAFLEFMEDETVLLREDYPPIIGADAVRYVTGMNDSTFTVNWDPQGGDVAESGDLGYTFGVYELRTAGETLTGSYVTVWKKQQDGKWKYALDASTRDSVKTALPPAE